MCAVTTKPEIESPRRTRPTELVVKDLVIGEGDEAQPGGVVEVHYLGVEYDTGEEFDSSWNCGESISFPLRGLIKGWQDGIPGMRVGAVVGWSFRRSRHTARGRRPPVVRQDLGIRHRSACGPLTGGRLLLT